MMTFDQFIDELEFVPDITVATGGDVPDCHKRGFVYKNLHIELVHRDSEVFWLTVIGNQQHESVDLRRAAKPLYDFAVSEHLLDEESLTAMNIWKYEVEIQDHFTEDIPEGSTFLCIQMQGLLPQMWWQVYENTQRIKRDFFVLGTGQQFDEPFIKNKQYLGTFQDSGYVWHLYMEMK